MQMQYRVIFAGRHTPEHAHSRYSDSKRAPRSSENVTTSRRLCPSRPITSKGRSPDGGKTRTVTLALPSSAAISRSTAAASDARPASSPTSHLPANCFAIESSSPGRAPQPFGSARDFTIPREICAWGRQ
eukprot:scaffold110603_cov34-Tisochrysis_lutea.AAC.4